MMVFIFAVQYHITKLHFAALLDVRITELLSMNVVIRYYLLIAVPNIMIWTIVLDLTCTSINNLSVLSRSLSQVRVVDYNSESKNKTT